jgi:hypothetical protein
MNPSRFVTLLSTLLISCTAQDALPQSAPNAAPTPAKTTPVQPAQVTARGILVGAPKIYDDYYLQMLLTSLKNNLANLQVVDQATLLSHIGNTQGGDLRQIGVAASAGGPQTPQVSTFALAPGVPAFMVPSVPSGATTPATATATASTPGTTTTQNSIVPTAPTPPAPSLSMPTFGQSSLDTLNESLQLSAEIMNVQLMLDGALTDRLQRSDGRPRSTYSIGFPVTVDSATAADKKHENEVAEIRVDVCPAAMLASDPPSIVTLLPKERTYNVASLVDKSFLGSVSAILGGAFNVGASFLWGHKTFYLVQQQETVAYQDASRRICGKDKDDKEVPAASFSWQVRPVLGKKYVRPGMSQEFVQVSFPQNLTEGKEVTIGGVWITVGWRKTTDKGNLMSETLEDPSDAVYFNLPQYKTKPAEQKVSVSDIGQGNVAVRVQGTFLPGVLVRIGSNVIVPVLSSKNDALTFSASAQDLVRADGAMLVSRGSEETPLLQDAAPRDPSIPPVAVRIKKDEVTITPYSDTQAKIVLPYDKPTGLVLDSHIQGDFSTSFNDPANNPWVVTIGDKVFGLRDNPFLENENSAIQLIAPNDLIAANRRIELRQLLWANQYFRDDYILNDHKFPLGGISISKISTILSGDRTELSITGSGLENAIVRYPPCPDCMEHIGATFATITSPKPPDPPAPAVAKGSKPPDDKNPWKDLKQVVLCRAEEKSATKCDAHYLPVVLDIPKDDGSAKPAPFKVEVPVLLTAKQIKISGDQVAKVAQVEFEKTQLNFQLSDDKKPLLLVDLPPSIVGRAGTYVLVITLEDKTTQVVPLTIKALSNTA